MKKIILMLGLLMTLTSCGFEVVDTGRRGVLINMGQVVGEPLPEGFHTYNPFTSSIREISIREEASTYKLKAYSKDNQIIGIEVVVVAKPTASKVHTIFKEYGEDFFEAIASKEIVGGVKDIIGQMTAGDIVSKREQLRIETEAYLKEKLAVRMIEVTGVDYTDMDFDDQYEKAVRDKVTAIEEAQAARNRTAKIEEEKKQKILEAQGDAEAMRIKSLALSQNKNLVEYEAVQRWDGKFPTTMMGGAVPFINIGK